MSFLKWEFDGRGSWEAASVAVDDDGDHYVWKIDVFDDGDFVIDTREMVQAGVIADIPRCYPLFRDAVIHCESEEAKIRQA